MMLAGSWMLLLTLVMFVEKLFPHGPRAAAVICLALVALEAAGRGRRGPDALDGLKPDPPATLPLILRATSRRSEGCNKTHATAEGDPVPERDDDPDLVARRGPRRAGRVRGRPKGRRRCTCSTLLSVALLIAPAGSPRGPIKSFRSSRPPASPPGCELAQTTIASARGRVGGRR
jgi:hypothetical protein